MEWYEITLEVLSGIVIVIPLVVELIKYVKQAAKEKNWKKLLELVTNLMKEAELKFDNGLERKEWVLVMVKASADTINYDIDLEQVAKLIDSLCEMTKVVNAPQIEEKVEEVV